MKSAHRIGTNHGRCNYRRRKRKSACALRQRVRSKLVESRIASNKRQRKADNEIVVQVSQSKEGGGLLLLDDEISDGERRRKIASTLVMIGALMGIVSGALILQGNPSGLLNSSIFRTTDSLDIHGLVLDEEGEAVANVSIELVDPETKSAIKSTTSDEFGRYVIDSVLVKKL